MSRFKVGEKVIISKGKDKGQERIIKEIWKKEKNTLRQYYLVEESYNNYIIDVLYDEENLDKIINDTKVLKNNKKVL